MKASEAKATSARYSKMAPKLGRVEAIDNRLTAIAQELRGTRGPLPPDEVSARFAAYLRHRQRSFEERRGGSNLCANDILSRMSAGKPLSFETLAPEQGIFDVILFLLGDRVETLAAEAVSRLAYEPGMPAAQRERLRADLEAERLSLVAERAELVNELRDLGVNVEHLPETQQQIDQAARAEELEAARRVRQAKAAARLDRAGAA